MASHLAVLRKIFTILSGEVLYIVQCSPIIALFALHLTVEKNCNFTSSQLLIVRISSHASAVQQAKA